MHRLVLINALAGLLLSLSPPSIVSAQAGCNPFVRATTPTGDFTLDDADGTTIHLKTGLTWMRCTLGQTWNAAGKTCVGSASGYTWGAALQAARGYVFAGHGDWRVPNVKELTSIVEARCFSPALNETVFPASSSFASSCVWSSSSYAGYAGYAWYESFGETTNVNYLGKGSINQVRLVRGGRPLDDFDAGGTLRITAPTKAEGQAGVTPLRMTVTLSPALTRPVTVRYATANGTAVAGGDYTAATRILTFTAGQTSQMVSVNVTGDTTVEPNEFFFVNLSASSGPTLADTKGRWTILNDDGPVLRINDVSKAEGNAGVTAVPFTVTLTPAGSNQVTVKYATANGTALAGSDYTAATGTLTFAPGQTSKPLSVNVKGDILVEPNDTFFLNLSASTGASVFDSQGLGTIANDD
jgi:hypothetical protein